MDLRGYYKHIREVESTIDAPFVVVTGLDTPDGGKAGTFSEVSRFVAARMITEGRARRATEEEGKLFREEQEQCRRKAEATAAAQKMQVTIVNPTDLHPARPGKPQRE